MKLACSMRGALNITVAVRPHFFANLAIDCDGKFTFRMGEVTHAPHEREGVLGDRYADPVENCFELDPTVEPDVLNTSESSLSECCESHRESDSNIAKNIKVVAEHVVYGMSGTEGQEPGGTDPTDLQLPRGATGSGREQSTPQSTAPVTRLIDMKSLLQVTSYHGDKASFLGWKWSFLVAVRAISKPLYQGLKKIEDNKNQDFPKIPIVR